MSYKNLVTQGELDETITGLDALAANLSEHVNQSLSKAHGWSILDSPYLDTGGNYHTDFGSGAASVSIPGLYNTGVNNDGTLAAQSTVDQHWTLVQSPDTTYPGPNAYVDHVSSDWSSDGPNSQWISPSPSAAVAGGTYKFRISFNLTGLNPSTAIIRGKWSSDNNTVSILLNGLSTGYSSGQSYTEQPTNSFYLTGPFLAGVNTLDFLVNNGGNTPAGVRVELTSVASPGGAVAITGIYNTGVNADGSLATQGTNDQHWTLLLSADPSNPGPNAKVVSTLSSTWAKNTTISQWIGPKATATAGDTVGNYAYRLTFDLTGYAPGTAILKGTFVSDDTVYKVLLNSQVTGINNGLPNSSNSNNQKYTTSFVISSGFVAGLNTLDFYVYNATQATGLRIEITGTAVKSGTGLVSRVLRLTIAGNVFFIPAQASGGMDGTADPDIPLFSGILSPQSADPATDLTVGSPTAAQLITAFAAALNAISQSASDALFQHAGSPAEAVHGGLSWQQDSIVSTGGYLVGRRTVNLTINGVQYKLVGDTNLTGPLNS